MRRRVLALAGGLLLLLTACEREQRRFAEVAPATGRSGHVQRPAGTPGVAGPSPGVRSPYEENAWAIAEGQRLYTWFNCQGCHGMGGGGMGPALMDGAWVYGSEPHDIFRSIAAGRPNGMPAFGTRLADQQVWQLVAYVRSLSALTRKDVRPGRSDTMQVRPAPQSTTPASPLTIRGPAEGPPR